MSFSVADLFRAVLLLLNAMAILSERRVLEPMGLSGTGAITENAGGKESVGQVLRSVRTLLRGPLVVLNAVTIVFTVIFG